MSRLSTTLINRLVLNLRERAVKQLPTTIETLGRFQAALPVARQALSRTSVRSPSVFRQNRSIVIATATRETVVSMPSGESRGQRLRSIDVIGYETERRSQATMSVGRQQPATYTSRSIGETVSVRTPRSADAIGYEMARKFQADRLVSRQPTTPTFIQSPSSARPIRSIGETASIRTTGAFQSADDVTR